LRKLSVQIIAGAPSITAIVSQILRSLRQQQSLEAFHFSDDRKGPYHTEGRFDVEAVRGLGRFTELQELGLSICQ
jgi:hypothetical protein